MLWHYGFETSKFLDLERLFLSLFKNNKSSKLFHGAICQLGKHVYSNYPTNHRKNLVLFQLFIVIFGDLQESMM